MPAAGSYDGSAAIHSTSKEISGSPVSNLSRGFEESRKIRATEFVRDWLPSRTLPDGFGSRALELVMKALTELVESSPRR